MSSEQLFCHECGTPNEADALYCENCGANLSEVAESTAAPVAAEAPVVTATPVQAAPHRGSSRKLLALVAGVVIVGGAAYALGTPIKGFIGSLGKDRLAAADSVQLVTDTAAKPQLKDVPSAPNAPAIAVATGNANSDKTVTSVFREIPRPTDRSAPTISQATRPDAPVRSPAAEVTREQATTAMPAEVAAAMREMAKQIPLEGAAAAAPVVTTREAPVTPAPARIASGSTLSLRASDQICTDKTREGARFQTVVQQDIEGVNGGRIPRGTIVTFVVDKLKRAAPNQKAEFSIAAESISLNGDSHPLSATVDAVTIKEKTRGLLGALAGAAAAAAAAKATGGDTKTTVAGGVMGGAAGAVIGSQLKTGDGCIEKNAPIRITLRSDITL